MISSLPQSNHPTIQSFNHRVSAIALTHFRNHTSFSLQPAGHHVVLTGPNGVGKTNLLEALSLFSPGRGLRGAKLTQLQQQQGTSPPQGWAVSLVLSNHTQLGTGQISGQPEKRVLRCNGEPLGAQSTLTSHLSLLWQTPQMDGIFGEGASDQRRFYDRLVYSFDVEHAARIARYEYYMKERNKLLAAPTPDGFWLGTLEQKMAEASVAIAAIRLEVLHHLQLAIDQLHPAFPKADIALQGAVENWLEQGVSALNAEEMLSTALRNSRQPDATSGRSSHGAHKMELQIQHREKQMPAALCSTGEQKALMLSILLAQSLSIQQKLGRVPILLLDEVVAHLDIHRREALFQAIGELGTQAWMTGTDAALMEGMKALDTMFVALQSA